MILALDLGTRFGWAVYYPGIELVESGFVDTKPKRHESSGMRFLTFERWLDTWNPKPKEIYYEEVRRHQGTAAAHVYGGFQATLQKWCVDNGVEYGSVPVGTIKKFATGSGNAKKNLMVKTAQADGLKSNDDNEADAWWLLKLKLAERGIIL